MSEHVSPGRDPCQLEMSLECDANLLLAALSRLSSVQSDTAMTALADAHQLQQIYLTLLTNKTQSLAWLGRLVDGAMDAINMVQLHKLVSCFVSCCLIFKRCNITHTQCGQGLFGWQQGGA